MLVGSMRFTYLIATSCVALLLWISAPSLAAQPTEVDVELVLAVDVSRSMTKRELEIQRRGYAEALSSNAVAKAVANGPIGRIALAYLEWGGTHWHRTIVDWTVIESQQDLVNFAAKLTIEAPTGRGWLVLARFSSKATRQWISSDSRGSSRNNDCMVGVAGALNQALNVARPPAVCWPSS